MNSNFNGVALITGPTSGIGKCFAIELAKQGYRLILVARNEQKLHRETCFLKEKYGVDVKSLHADLSTEEGLIVVEDYISKLQQLDLLINNAGFGVGGYFIEVPFVQQMAMLNVHLSSTVRFCRAAIPIMNTHGGGRIINVASFAAFINVPGSVMYSTTKAAVVRFSKLLQLEIKG